MSRRMDTRLPYARPLRWSLTGVLLGLASLCACTSWKHGSRWSEGGTAPLLDLPKANLLTEVEAGVAAEQPLDLLQEARRRFDEAERQAFKKSPTCVDDFYSAAVLSWAAYVQSGAASRDPWSDQVSAFKLYHESLARLIHEGQTHGRLNPRAGLIVHDRGERRVVPLELNGFHWQPDDFHQWIVVQASLDHSQPKRAGCRRAVSDRPQQAAESRT